MRLVLTILMLCCGASVGAQPVFYDDGPMAGQGLPFSESVRVGKKNRALNNVFEAQFSAFQSTTNIVQCLTRFCLNPTCDKLVFVIDTELP